MEPRWQDSHGALYQGDVRAVLAEMPAASCQVVCCSPPYHGLRSYQTEPQLWGGSPGCDHVLDDAASVLRTGGNGVASTKQVTNVGSQAGNGWTLQHPPGYRASDTNPGPLQHTGNIGRETRGGAVCTRCGAYYGELGCEPTIAQYVANMVAVFRGVWRVLRDDGTLWLNLGDSYASGETGRVDADQKYPGLAATLAPGRERRIYQQTGLPPKNLIGMPWRVAFALQDDGWILRSAITLCKVAPMPESVRDRPTQATEMLFLFSKQPTYFYDAEAVRETAIHEGRLVKASGASAKNGAGATETNDRRTAAGFTQHDTLVTGRNLRNWMEWRPEPSSLAHYAAFPRFIPRLATQAGTSERGCCAACGAPWKRITKPTAEYQAVLEAGRQPEAWKGERRAEAIHIGVAFGDKAVSTTRQVETVAWTPTCTCGCPETRPCVVLDPFLGSGTTALVARQLGRIGWGCELNPEYAQMAINRLRQHVLL